MRAGHFLSGTCIAVAIMLLMTVSVQPVMAAEAINEKTGYCPTCSTGDSDPAFLAAYEGRNLPTVTIREISTAPDTSVLSVQPSGSETTASGTEKRQSRMVTMDIRDPRLGLGREQETFGTSAAGAADLPAAILANLSSEGYDLTGESTHRYESTVTSEELLSLNSSQKAAIIAGGAVFTAGDSVLSYRDMTYYAFTNRTTQALRYVVNIQQLDMDKNPAGEPEYAYSPEFPPGRGATAQAALSAAAENTCFWKWLEVIGIVAGLVVLVYGIVGIATATAVTGGMVWAVLGPVIGALFAFCHNAYNASDGKEIHDIIYFIEVVSFFFILIPLIKAVYELGICMGWWEPDFWKPVIWSYQYSFTDADNGQQVSANLNDRFALTLAADTLADKDAHWEIQSRTDGLLPGDERSAMTGNATLRSWLIGTTRPGTQTLVMHYVTDKPLPPAIPSPVYTLTVSVSAGSWTITPVTEASSFGDAGQYTSLVIGRDTFGRAVPYISYYDAVNRQVRIAVRDTDWWGTRRVADSAGTYTTSLALDAAGNPSISFGDGLHYGNLMYAHRNGTQWEAAVVDRGIGYGRDSPVRNANRDSDLGNAGRYSSLKTDGRGSPHISYNDEINAALLKYAEWNGTGWQISIVDGTGDAYAGADSSLALDAAGKPYISYRAGNNFANLMYAEKPDDTWTITKVDRGGSITGDTGYFTSLALDSAGDPHISYYDERNGDLRYASRNGSDWILEKVDSMGDVGRYTSLVIDDQDQPHIGYYDATNHALKYATSGPESGKWVTKTVDDDGDAGQFASVALNPAGHPCFSYYDATRHQLKYAEWKK